VQVARKLAGPIARARQPLRVKLEAAAHLLSNCGYPFVVLLAALLPLIATDEAFAPWAHAAAFVVCTCSVAWFYASSQRAVARSLVQRLVDVPAAMALGIGVCLSQSLAVLSGLRGARSGEFVRTPKRGDAPAGARYRSARGVGSGWGELAFALWFGLGIVRAVRSGLWGSLPFLLLFALGFAWVATLSLVAARESSGPCARREKLADISLAGEASPG
jgi:hypothetical protein